MSASHPILSRLDTGRPLLVSADAAASLAAAGVSLVGPAAIGRMIREQPSAVSEHYHREIGAGVDVLAALTADTIPRSLLQIGMPFRSAALTGSAVDLALDAADGAPRPLIVAGVLGTTEIPPTRIDRMTEELGLHAARLATAGCELLLARGFDSVSADPNLARLARRAAVISAAATQLPTWAVISLGPVGFTADGEPADECARAAAESGAQVVLLEVPSADAALGWLDRLQEAAGDARVGFAPASAGASPEAWAADAHRLLDAGVRVLGGGPGTTTRHIAALSALLRGSDRQSFWPRAV